MSVVLVKGDCLEKMRDIPDRSVDLVLCDLPYGTTACSWDSIIPFEDLWAAYKRVCKKGAAVVLTASQPFTSTLIVSNLAWFKYEWIWEKTKSGSPFLAKFQPMRKHENVVVFSVGGGKTNYNPQMTTGGEPYYRHHKTAHAEMRRNEHGYGAKGGAISESDGSRYPTSVQKFAQDWRRQDQVHPTQKPVALMEYLVRTYTNLGDTVLDNCMGSGTTGVACVNTGRNFIGIEKDPAYFDIAEARIAAASAMTNDNDPLYQTQDIFA